MLVYPNNYGGRDKNFQVSMIFELRNLENKKNARDVFAFPPFLHKLDLYLNDLSLCEILSKPNAFQDYNCLDIKLYILTIGVRTHELINKLSGEASNTLVHNISHQAIHYLSLG